jgi:hypothetical protein
MPHVQTTVKGGVPVPTKPYLSGVVVCGRGDQPARCQQAPAYKCINTSSLTLVTTHCTPYILRIKYPYSTQNKADHARDSQTAKVSNKDLSCRASGGGDSVNCQGKGTKPKNKTFKPI